MGNAIKKESTSAPANQCTLVTDRGNRFLITINSADENSKLVVFLISKANMFVYKYFLNKIDNVLIYRHGDVNQISLLNDVIFNLVQKLNYWPKNIIIVTDCAFGDTVVVSLVSESKWPGFIFLIDPRRTECADKYPDQVFIYRSKEEMIKKKSFLAMHLELDIHRLINLQQ